MGLRDEGFWDKHYELELKNFEDNGDEGDVWFGEPLTKRVVSKIIQEITGADYKYESAINILDIGCGNTFLLSTLVGKVACMQSGIENRLKLFGVDYSKQSIELSKRIVKAKNLEKQIHLEQCNFLNLTEVARLNNGEKFDFVIDKGTFDAICLLSNDVETTRLLYSKSVNFISKPGTIFILASCNHTKDDLLALFNTGSRLSHRLMDTIETPKIRFGGKEGSQVSCLVLKFG